MTFVQPLALLLLLPAAGLAAWLWFRRGRAGTGLPGHWNRIVDTAMQSFMVGRVVARRRLPVGFWCVLWTLLVLALSRPVLDLPQPAATGNLAGRVIAMDLGVPGDTARQRMIAYRILDAAPEIPTALVAATGEAFDVVPFTTDRTHLDRYLAVIKPGVMPVSGRAPGLAITHAETLLDRAGMIVGQTVLLTGGAVPLAQGSRAGNWLRAVVADRTGSDWERYAGQTEARLVDDHTLGVMLDDLDHRIADTLRDRDDALGLAAAPWLIAAAAGLWLLFFRRIRSA